MLVLADQPDGIGFLIAAKSILRFDELQDDRRPPRSEYVIIGTLASFAWAIATAAATGAALARSAPLECRGAPHYLQRNAYEDQPSACSAFPARRPSP